MCMCENLRRNAERIIIYEFSVLNWFYYHCDNIAINAIQSFNDPSPSISADITSCIIDSYEFMKLSLQESTLKCKSGCTNFCWCCI